MKALLAGAAVLVLASCGCDEGRLVLECATTDFLYELCEDQYNDVQRQGWECLNTDIRNAFGRWIGTRHDCTICR